MKIAINFKEKTIRTTEGTKENTRDVNIDIDVADEAIGNMVTEVINLIKNPDVLKAIIETEKLSHMKRISDEETVSVEKPVNNSYLSRELDEIIEMREEIIKGIYNVKDTSPEGEFNLDDYQIKILAYTALKWFDEENPNFSNITNHVVDKYTNEYSVNEFSDREIDRVVDVIMTVGRNHGLIEMI